MCEKIEITGPDQFTEDELLTIYDMTGDWGAEYGLDADSDKVQELRVRVRKMLELRGWK